MKREAAIRMFLSAFGARVWDLRAIPRTGTGQPKCQTLERHEIDAALSDLSRRNCLGSEIYCRPLRDDALIGWVLVDDVASTSCDALKKEGACAIVCTSSGNLQAWFRLAFPVERERAQATANMLTAKFSGDIRCARNAEQVGRLPGFTNQKPERRIGKKAPLVYLVWHQSNTAIQPASEPCESGYKSQQPTHATGGRKGYGIDRSAKDFAAGKRLFESGASEAEVAAWLMSHSLKAPGNEYYCSLTARKICYR